MKQDYYLSGISNFTTRRFRVFGRTVEETAQLGRLLGLDPKTVIVGVWSDEYAHRKTVTTVTHDVFQIHAD